MAGKGGTTKVILLKGDRRNPESAEHIIKFPGGSIAVTRTSDNEYWAHIQVNRKESGLDIGGIVEEKNGEIVDTRIDYDRTESEPMGRIEEFDTAPNISHMAVRITTR